MKKEEVWTIILILLLIAFVAGNLYGTPKGTYSFGRCGEAHPNSKLCFCLDNETKVQDELNQNICEIKQEVK